jgi:hypothetical protein
LPGDALVSDELSPQARLTGLHLGQEWTVPVFSPLRDPRSPVEILQARVDSRDLLMWEGEAISVFQVVYRPDSGAALSSTGGTRAKLWVRDDGTVLKQEVSVLNSKIVFLRNTAEQSASRAKQSDDEISQRGMFRRRNWWRSGNPPAAAPGSANVPTDSPTPPTNSNSPASNGESSSDNSEARLNVQLEPAAAAASDGNGTK